VLNISHIPINIKIENIGQVKGELIQFLAPRTINAILRKLPFEGRAALLEHQVYFGIPVKVGKEKPISIVEKGTIAYWPMGTAFCIYFEKTQPYSAVNKIGKVIEHIDLIKKVVNGTKIRIEKG
jgi:hypothetical protein